MYRAVPSTSSATAWNAASNKPLGDVFERQEAVAPGGELREVLVDGVLNALPEVGMLVPVASEVVAAVSDVAAHRGPRDAVDSGVLTLPDSTGNGGVLDGSDVGLEEALSGVVEPLELAAHADHLCSVA